MTLYSRGDVVLLPFPFTDLTTTKQRPALIISGKKFNEHGSDVVACAITSQNPMIVNDFELTIPPKNTLDAGLPKPSKVKCGKIVTLDSRLIRKKLGVLPSTFITNVLDLIGNILSN